MIIKEIDNITYQINLPNSNINIYNKDSLERITKKIFKKITNKKKLNPLLILDIYENNMYGTIITLQQYCMKVNRQKRKLPLDIFLTDTARTVSLLFKNTPLYFYALTVSTNLRNAFLPSSVHL